MLRPLSPRPPRHRLRARPEALADLPGRVRLTAIAEPDPARAAALARRFRVPHVYGDADTLLANEHLDLVHICTPPQTHAPLAAAATTTGLGCRPAHVCLPPDAMSAYT
ncbi:Gfo/Idh/MocA family oxidoreductase [Streptomyces sp. TRM72054]|uniref:Gfo/Idh/MocA family oxidoreductase n=1 Tax=Streptomyces sp. TRM72054 TaxID=2870562 RepID=UPI001C8C448B|nr:Gfo/Idh/MocA family oxidoreductase [Streptomyces sp. TRM72054]